MAHQRKFIGPYGIILTPFTESGNVNFDLLEKQVDRVCRSGIAGVVACGTTSEFSLLSFEENVQILKTVKKVVGDRIQVIGGATAGDAMTTIRYLDKMAALGLDGALTAPSYYLPMNDEDVAAYYRLLSDADTGTDIVAYNIPMCTSPVTLRSFQEILTLGNVQGMKNSSGSLNEIMHEMDIRDRIRPDFSVLTGSDESILAETLVGCDGNFTACAYLLPEIVALIYGQDRILARKAQYGILRLIRLANSFTFPYGYKLIGRANGFDFGASRQVRTASMTAREEQVVSEMHAIVEELYETLIG